MNTPNQLEIAFMSFVCLCFFFLVGCPSPKPYVPPPASSAPVALPADWPIPDLTMPPNSTSDTIPYYYLGDADKNSKVLVRETLVGKSWLVAFDTNIGTEAVYKHFIDQMRPLGIIQTSRRENRGGEFIEFKSTDNSFSIQLAHETGIKNALHESYDCFTVSVTKLSD
jgi:hypothetical protein